MNKHFEDTQYYLTRAGKHAKQGLAEELEPVETKFRELVGREKEPEPSRLEEILNELRELEQRAEGEAKAAITDARGKLRAFLDERTEKKDA